MAVPIPFPYIRSLPKADQQRLKRDFDSVLAQISSTKVYDAYVNPLLLADNTDTRTFTTPFAAIRYVADTLGQTWVSIGWIKPPSGTTVTATETGNYGGTNSCRVSIDVVGSDSDYASPLTGAATAANWDIQGFADSVKFSSLALNGVAVTSSLGTGSAVFQSGGCVVRATNCAFVFNGHARINNTSMFATNCSFTSCGWGRASGTLYLEDCFINRMLDEVISGNVVTSGCHFTNIGATTFRGQVFIASDSKWTQYSSGASVSVGTLTIDTTGTTRVYISSAGEEGNLDQGVAVAVTAAVQYVWLEGNFWSVAVAAPPVSSSSGGVSLHHVDVRCNKTFDVTGPAEISATAELGGNFLRGPGLSGNVMCGGSQATGVGLSFVGVVDSVVLAVFQPYGTAGTGQAYTIDAASARNTILTAGSSLFPGTSSNSSTTTIVINNTATFPINGRDSTGDALNKDMLPSLLVPTGGIATYPAPVTPTGTTIDTVHHDLIPSLLVGTLGVLTYPPASLSLPITEANVTGLVGDLAETHRTLLPALLVPAAGIVTYPAPAATAGVTIDTVHHDIIPAILLDSTGIITYPVQPIPELGVQNLVADLIARPTLLIVTEAVHRDFIPALFAPAEGVVVQGGAQSGARSPGVTVTNTATQAIATATNTILNIPVPVSDPWGMRTSATQLKVPNGWDGWWLLAATLGWPAGADATRRIVWLSVNGAPVTPLMGTPAIATAGIATVSAANMPVLVKGGDLITVSCRHDSATTPLTIPIGNLVLSAVFMHAG